MTRLWISETNGEGVAPMRIALSAEAFANCCQFIVDNFKDDAAHRALDALVTSLLTSLGYGEGMEIFLTAVALRHDERVADVIASVEKEGANDGR